MRKSDLADVVKANTAPVIAALSTNAWHLDDWVKVCTIGALVVSTVYTLWKWWAQWRRLHPLDTEAGK